MHFLKKLIELQPELLAPVETAVKIQNSPYMTLTVENIGLGLAASPPCLCATMENRTATSCAIQRCVLR